ncbi:TonB-dependent receptor plug domain-containing protein (plasmid) [Sphingomonas zeae]
MAQPAPDEVAFTAAFYAAFSVQNALDMIDRTPGFVLDEIKSVRGFGGAASNVLIDGERPTTKAGSMADLLRRIPASRVARIVLIRGGGLAAQAQGQTLIANIVLVADPANGGTITVTASLQRDGTVAPTAELTYGRGLGRWTASGTLSVLLDRRDVRGVYRILDADGELLESWRERFPRRSVQSFAAGNLKGPLAGGSFDLNLRLAGDVYRDAQRLEIRSGLLLGPLLEQRRLTIDEHYREVEVGADWSRDLGADWSLKLVSLVHDEFDRIEQAGVNEGGRTLSLLRQSPFESLGRVTVTRGGDHRLLPEIGAELAYTRLDSRLFFARDTGDGLEEQVLPGSDTQATEWRGEVFANLTYRVARTARLEMGLAGEWSRIGVTGDIADVQTLGYAKPSAAVVWDVRPRLQLRFGIRRTVDQLEFEDFAASVQGVDDRPISGNARLRPARITRFQARVDQRWGKAGAVSGEAFVEQRQGVLDYVPTLSGSQTIGIAGDGRIVGATVQATVPVDVVLNGAQITVDATRRWTRLHVPDAPDRPLSGLPSQEAKLAFRHDWQAIASSWGADWTTARITRIFYVDEVERTRVRPLWTVYAETSAWRPMRISLTLRGLTGVGSERRRDFFERPGSGAFTGSQFRRRDSGLQAILKIVRPL